MLFVGEIYAFIDTSAVTIYIGLFSKCDDTICLKLKHQTINIISFLKYNGDFDVVRV